MRLTLLICAIVAALTPTATQASQSKSPDKNLVRVIRDLYEFRAAVNASEPADDQKPSSEHTQVQWALRVYIRANLPIMVEAFASWERCSVDQLKKLQTTHDLNHQGVLRSYRDIAFSSINAALHTHDIDSDQIEQTIRLLQYSEHLADTSKLSLRLQPIEALLPRKIRKSYSVSSAVYGKSQFEIVVAGGLPQENRAIFDLIQNGFNSDWSIEQAAYLAEGKPKQTTTAPYLVYLLATGSDAKALSRCLEENGFELRE